LLKRIPFRTSEGKSGEGHCSVDIGRLNCVENLDLLVYSELEDYVSLKARKVFTYEAVHLRKGEALVECRRWTWLSIKTA